MENTLYVWYGRHMRKAGSYTLSTLILLLASTTPSFASTSVKIEGNEGNASAKVSIQNNFNSTGTSTNTVDTHTKVRIETNGEVKEYESTDGKDVTIESSDGSSKVNITNKSNTTPPPSTLGAQEKNNDATRQATQNAEKKTQSLKEKQKDFFEKLEELIRNFFANLF